MCFYNIICILKWNFITPIFRDYYISLIITNIMYILFFIILFLRKSFIPLFFLFSFVGFYSCSFFSAQFEIIAIYSAIVLFLFILIHSRTLFLFWAHGGTAVYSGIYARNCILFFILDLKWTIFTNLGRQLQFILYSSDSYLF